MKRAIKNLSILVLACFISTSVAGGACGEENKIKFTYQIVDSSNVPFAPQVNDFLKLKIQATYDGKQIESLKIKDPDKFTVLKETREGAVTLNGWVWTYVFEMKAPQKKGTYNCQIEGLTANGQNFNFNLNIDIFEKNIASLENIKTFGIIIGSVILFYVILGAFKTG